MDALMNRIRREVSVPLWAVLVLGLAGAVIGGFLGNNTSLGSKELTVKTGRAMLHNSENWLTFFDTDDPDDQLSFNADSVWYLSSGSKGHGAPPCLQEGESTPVRIGYTWVDFPDGGGAPLVAVPGSGSPRKNEAAHGEVAPVAEGRRLPVGAESVPLVEPPGVRIGVCDPEIGPQIALLRPTDHVVEDIPSHTVSSPRRLGPHRHDHESAGLVEPPRAIPTVVDPAEASTAGPPVPSRRKRHVSSSNTASRSWVEPNASGS